MIFYDYVLFDGAEIGKNLVSRMLISKTILRFLSPQPQFMILPQSDNGGKMKKILPKHSFLQIQLILESKLICQILLWNKNLWKLLKKIFLQKSLTQLCMQVFHLQVCGTSVLCRITCIWKKNTGFLMQNMNESTFQERYLHLTGLTACLPVLKPFCKTKV